MKTTSFFLLCLLINLLSLRGQDYADVQMYILTKTGFYVQGDSCEIKLVFNRKINDKLMVRLNNKAVCYTIDKEAIIIKEPASNIGMNKITGEIYITQQEKKIKTFNLEYAYTVAPLFAVVCNQNNKMKLKEENVFDISIHGIMPHHIVVETDNGTIDRRVTQCTIIPDTLGECNLTVYTMEKGKKKLVSTHEYLVIE